MIRYLLALLCGATLCAGAMAAPQPPRATLDTGTVQGVVEDGEIVFRGIPFAAPPIGPLRWRAPQPATPWTGVRSAERFGAMCMQPGGGTPGQAMDEDCLFLNIFRPRGDVRGLPVLFWIPGGGFVAGSASQPIYDGKALAARGVIVVTINYRVGRFGFFAHPDLSRQNADNGHFYNYGLMDQIAALQWVRRNIAGFGGDPAKVTIFGQSAGGASVDALMIAPDARGLFAAAISQSGYGRGAYARLAERSWDGDAPAEQIGTTIAGKLGMADAGIDALRAVPAARILALFDSNDWVQPAVDGGTITGDLWTSFAKGLEAPVPFLLGSNTYEMGMAPAQEQRPWAEMFVPHDRWDRLTPFYDNDPALRDRLILSDLHYSTQADAIASRHAANGFPTWVYSFDVPSVFKGKTLPGAAHAADLPYVFGNLAIDNHGLSMPDDADRRLSHEMMAYWVNLARKGDPNATDLQAWPRYRDHMLLHIAKTGSSAMVDPLKARIDMLDQVATDIIPPDKPAGTTP